MHFNKVLLPKYLCNSLYIMLDKKQIEYKFYNINRKLLPIIEEKIDSDTVVVIINYFGMLNNEQLFQLKKIYGNIIVDNTQSFFQQPIEGIPTLYNCRKYFGVSDGAYISGISNTNDYDKLDFDRSYNRLLHLFGRMECGASLFYNQFKITIKN